MHAEATACAQGGSPAHRSPKPITSQRVPSRVDGVLAVLPPVGDGIAFRYERGEVDYHRVRPDGGCPHGKALPWAESAMAAREGVGSG